MKYSNLEAKHRNRILLTDKKTDNIYEAVLFDFSYVYLKSEYLYFKVPINLVDSIFEAKHGIISEPVYLNITDVLSSEPQKFPNIEEYAPTIIENGALSRIKSHLVYAGHTLPKDFKTVIENQSETCPLEKLRLTCVREDLSVDLMDVFEFVNENFKIKE